MKMTIKQLINFYENNPFNMPDSIIQKELLPILRKYQKIEEIVELYKKFGNIDIFMQIIREVIENGDE